MLYSVGQGYMDSKRGKMTGFRLYESEETRLLEVLAEIKKRNKYMDKSKLLRQIIGFEPRLDVTPEEIHYLRTGERVPDVHAEEKQQRKHNHLTVLSPRRGIRAMQLELMDKVDPEFPDEILIYYAQHLKGTSEEFLKLPIEQQEAAIAAWEDRLDEYIISARRKSG